MVMIANKRKRVTLREVSTNAPPPIDGMGTVADAGRRLGSKSVFSTGRVARILREESKKVTRKHTKSSE